MNAIIRDVVSGPVLILRRLLTALKQRQAFLSIDPETEKAELVLAELHQVLLFKKESHGLTTDDERFLDKTKPCYDKQQAKIDSTQIKLAISMARLMEQEYVSPISSQPLNLYTIKKAIDKLEEGPCKPQNKQPISAGSTPYGRYR